MDKNKIKYGLKNVYYAVATIAADGSATYGEPKRIPGAVNLGLDAQGETEPFYADDIEYYVSVANDGYEGDLEIALAPDDFRVDVLGDFLDGNGVMVEDSDAPVTHFALLFQFAGDVHAKRHVMYNCVATRPSVTGATKEANIAPQTETLTLSAATIYVPALDKNVVKSRVTPDEATQYDAWFEAVYLPTAPNTEPNPDPNPNP